MNFLPQQISYLNLKVVQIKKNFIYKFQEFALALGFYAFPPVGTMLTFAAFAVRRPTTTDSAIAESDGVTSSLSSRSLTPGWFLTYPQQGFLLVYSIFCMLMFMEIFLYVDYSQPTILFTKTYDKIIYFQLVIWPVVHFISFVISFLKFHS